MLGDHQMDFETIEKASFARLIAAPFCTTVKMASANAIIVACSYRKTIHHVNRVLVQRFPGFTQQAEQHQEQIGYSMIPPIETTFSQHLGNIAVFPHVCSGFLHIPAKVQRCDDGSRHHFSIADLALGVFKMMERFQQIVTKAKNCYYSG